MDQRVKPTVYTFNTVMGQLVKRGETEKALQVRDEMLQYDIEPDIITCNTVLDGLFKAEPPRIHEAEAFFLEMLDKGPKPDQYTFSILLRAYQPPTQQQQQRTGGGNPLEAIKNAVVRGPMALSDAAGNGPSSQAMNKNAADSSARLSSSPSAAFIPGPQKLFDMLLSNQDIVLDTAAVNTLILAFLRNGSVRKALEIFNDFKIGKFFLMLHY